MQNEQIRQQVYDERTIKEITSSTKLEVGKPYKFPSLCPSCRKEGEVEWTVFEHRLLNILKKESEGNIYLAPCFSCLPERLQGVYH